MINVLQSDTESPAAAPRSICDSTSVSSVNFGFNDDLIESSIEQQIRRGQELLAQKYKEPRSIEAEEPRGLHLIEPSKKHLTSSSPRRSKRSFPRSNSTSPCPMRVVQLAAPPKRYCLETWRAKCNVLPPRMAERLKSHVYDQMPIVPLADAADLFQNEKKKRKKRSTSQEKGPKSGALLFEMRNFCVIFAHHVAQQLNDKFCVNLDKSMMTISEIVSTEIRKMMKDDDDLGNLDKNFTNAMHCEVSDRVSIWISNILDRASQIILEEDLKAKNRIVRKSERKVKEDQVVTWVGTYSPSKTTDSCKDLEEEEGPILDFLDDVMDNVMTICTPNKRGRDQDSSSDGDKFNELDDDNDNVNYEKSLGSSEYGESTERSKSPEVLRDIDYLDSGKTSLSIVNMDELKDTFYDSEENDAGQFVFEELLTTSTSGPRSESDETNAQSVSRLGNKMEEKPSALVSNKLDFLVTDSESEQGIDTTSFRAQTFLTNVEDEIPLFNQDTTTNVNKTSHEKNIHQEVFNVDNLSQEQDLKSRNSIISSKKEEKRQEEEYEVESSENKGEFSKDVENNRANVPKEHDITSIHESLNTVPANETDIPGVLELNDKSENEVAKLIISEAINQTADDVKFTKSNNVDEQIDYKPEYDSAVIKTAPTESSITDDDNKSVSTITRYESLVNKAIVVQGEEDVDKYLDTSYNKPTQYRDDVFHILDDVSLTEEMGSSRKVKFFGGSEEDKKQEILKDLASKKISEERIAENTLQIFGNKGESKNREEPDSRSSYRQQHVHIFSEPKQSLISDMDEEWPADIPKNALRLSLSVSKSILSLGNIRESDEVDKHASIDSDKIQTPIPTAVEEVVSSTMVSIVSDLRTQKVSSGNYEDLLAISNEIHEAVSIGRPPVKVPAKHHEPELTILPQEDKETIEQSDTESIELLITKRNLKNIQKQKEMFDKINIYAKMGVPDKADTIEMEGDHLRVRISRTKQAGNEKSSIAEKRKFKPKINYTVDPKSAPAWVQRAKNTKTDKLAPELPTVASVEIRDWAKVLDKFSLDISTWSQWVDTICHQVYDMSTEKEVFVRPEAATNESNTAQWVEFRERVERQALQWRKINLEAKRETSKLKSTDLTHKRVTSHQPRLKSESFVAREREMINALDDIDNWSTWIHRTVVATEHVMRTDTRSNEAFQRWRRLRHTLNSEGQAWQDYHEQTKREYKSRFQFTNDNERYISD